MNSDGIPSSSSSATESGERRRLFGGMRSRVLGAMILISLVPVSLVAYQGYHCARQAVVEHVYMHLVSVIEARRALLDEWLKERTAEIETLASLPGVIESTKRLAQQEEPEVSRALASLLDSVQATGESYETLTVYDLRWKMLAKASRRNHEDREFLTGKFRSGMNEAAGVLFDAAHLHKDGNVGVHVGYPLRDVVGKKIGFIVANLNLSNSLNPLLQERSGLWRTGKVYVISPELNILSEPFASQDLVAMREKTNRAVLESVSEGGPLVREYTDYLGHDVLGTAMPLKLNDWLLVAEMDATEALEWLRILLMRATIMVTATLILVVFVSISISKFLGRPLKELERVARRIREGHVNDRLAPMSGREAEEVRRTFNLMLDELRDKQEEIIRTATLASVGELSTSIVHELRNPLSSVKMNLQALCKVVEDDENYRELASIASEQVTRLERMLTDLLQYGRPLELRREPISFEEMANATLDVVVDVAKEKEVEIVVEDSLGAKLLHIDREQMCRVLSNLVINAVQASPPGSKVTLAARNLPGDSGSISIEVLDTGCGLTTEAQENVFKPFFSTKPDGTGLGLANVKKIVELHGGTVSARNRSEGGSAFLFTVPVRPAPSYALSDDVR